MKKYILRLSFMFAIIGVCGACAGPQLGEGPGMTVHFSSVIPAKRIHLLDATTHTHQGFPNAGSFGPNPNPITGGKTMGAAPDGRELPDWVEFEWTEWPYPSPSEPKEPVALQAWNERFDLLVRTLSHKRARVPIRSRVPQDVIDEVLTSNRQSASNTLPDKMLWVYFIWYDTGIKLRWKLKSRCCGLLREGGDDIGQ